MKYIKFLFISFVVVIIVACIGVFIFIKTFDANKYKSQITERISSAINKPVDIGRIDLDLSLSDGFRLELSKLKIQGLAEVESTYVVIDANAYLKNREIIVSKVIIRKPKIEYTNEDLADSQPSNEVNIKSIQSNSAESDQQESVPDFTVQLIEIVDGRLEVVDQSDGALKKYIIRRFNARLTDFAFNRSFQYELGWALFSDNKENFKMNGQGIFYSSNQNIRLHDLKANIDLGLVSKEVLMSEISGLELNSIDSWKGGMLNLELDQLLITKDGLGEINILGKLDDLELKVADFKEPLTIQSEFTADESLIDLRALAIKLADGEIKGKGQIKKYLLTPDYHFMLDITNVNIAKIVDPSQFPKQIEGMINGNMSILGKGLDKASIENHLSGQGEITVANGEIKDFNLLRYVIESVSLNQVKGIAEQVGVNVSSFENFSEELKGNLSEQYKERLEQDNTILREVKINIKLAAGHVFLDPIRLEADGFIFNAKSDIDLEQHLDFNSSIYLAQDFSQSMIQTEDELSFLMDEYNQMKIPFTDYKGDVKKFKTRPSLKGLSQQVLKNKGRDELKKALRKVLNSDEAEVVSEDGTAELESGEKVDPKKKGENIEDVLADTVIDILSNF